MKPNTDHDQAVSLAKMYIYLTITTFILISVLSILLCVSCTTIQAIGIYENSILCCLPPSAN